MEIYSFSRNDENLRETMGESPQSDYIIGYLEELEAKSVIIEENYIDKDYLIDYSNFYSRSFTPYERYTKRIHFFSNDFSKDQFLDRFHSDSEFQSHLNNTYLGFVVIRKMGESKNDRFIGRTILKTYPNKVDTESRFFITQQHPVSLYGVPLFVESLPYHTQNHDVAACATTAIWTSLHALNSLFGTQKQSPFEITKSAVSFPRLERNFPSSGLDLYQMKDYFNSAGLETECINVEQDVNVIPDLIKAHLDFGLPVLALLELHCSD